MANIRTSEPPRRGAPRALAALLALCLSASGCAQLEALWPRIAALAPRPPARAVPHQRAQERAEQRADEERLDRLERENERLRADLHQAEDALIAAESGLKGVSTRADAVSAVAEARIRLARAATRAPWRTRGLEEAESKLEEADRLVEAQHFGVAIFFASRAQRIAVALVREGTEAQSAGNTRWIRSRRVNMRAGPSTRYTVIAVLAQDTPVFEEKVDGEWALVRTPSGQIGWIFRSLLAEES